MCPIGRTSTIFYLQQEQKGEPGWGEKGVNHQAHDTEGAVQIDWKDENGGRAGRKVSEQKDVVLLDSVISDNRCEYYKYNDYGWLISAKIYEWEDGAMQLDTDESYLLEYTFDEQGRCTYYGEFAYNADGTKGQEITRVETTWTGSRERTEKYYAVPDEWNELEPTAEISYDKFGNYCLMIF